MSTTENHTPRTDAAIAKINRPHGVAEFAQFARQLEKTIKPRPTPERLRYLLDYDPKTGLLTWKHSLHGGAPKGHVVTRRHPKGYLSLNVDGYQLLAHRVAFAIHEGRFPRRLLDHRNLLKDDNRWENLRECSTFGNVFNRPKSRVNTSGIKGVFRHSYSGKWWGRVWANGKQHVVGCHSSKQRVAEMVRALRERLHGEFANHG